MMHDGMQVVRLRDNGEQTYMGRNGTTTNGKLMIQLRDMADVDKQLEAFGLAGRTQR